MNHPRICRIPLYLSLGLVGLFSVLTAPSALSAERPNIVFILSDDHRADVMGAAGDPYIDTPHLDKLAAEGVRFKNAFAVSGTCSPSRAAFWTGRYAHAASAPYIVQQNNSFLETQTVFPELLHDAGYHTAFMGKWHLGLATEPKRGFDYWAGWEHGDTEDQVFYINGEAEETEGFTDDALSEMAADYIRKTASRETPFFLYVGLRSPHRPFAYPERLEDAFDGVEIPKPATFDENYRKSGKDPILQRCRIRAKNMSFYRSFGTWDNFVKSYYRSAQSIDDSVGTIMDALRRAGIEDNTIVVYSSDHGYSLGDHGMVEKHFAYEPIMRIPFVMKWPGRISGGLEPEAMVSGIDLAPTLLSATGVAVPDTVQGRSLIPLIKNGGETPEDWREDVLFVFESRDGLIPGQIALRTERHKLVTYTDRATVELYDLVEDPGEAQSLAADPEYADLREELKTRLKERLAETEYQPRPVRQALPFVWALRGVDAGAARSVSEWYAEHPFDPGARLHLDCGTFEWERVFADADGNYSTEALCGEEGDRALLALTIERKTRFDPHVSIWVAPWPLTRMYRDGEILWTYDPAIRVPGNVCNPPLPKEKNLVLLSIENMKRPFSILWEAPLDSVVINGETHKGPR